VDFISRGTRAARRRRSLRANPLVEDPHRARRSACGRPVFRMELTDPPTPRVVPHLPEPTLPPTPGRWKSLAARLATADAPQPRRALGAHREPAPHGELGV